MMVKAGKKELPLEWSDVGLSSCDLCLVFATCRVVIQHNSDPIYCILRSCQVVQQVEIISQLMFTTTKTNCDYDHFPDVNHTHVVLSHLTYAHILRERVCVRCLPLRFLCEVHTLKHTG